jgi:hypothetical protein
VNAEGPVGLVFIHFKRSFKQARLAPSNMEVVVKVYCQDIQKVTLYDWDGKLSCTRGVLQTIPVVFCRNGL